MEPVFGSALAGGRAADLIDAWSRSDLRPRIAAERIAPLLAWSLRRTGELARCPDSLRQYLEASAREAAVLALLEHRELERVTAAIAARGVTPILFKGAALGLTHYEDPSLRPRDDTDILCAESAFPAVERALVSDLGYRRAVEQSGRSISHQAHYHCESAGVDHGCDVHWKPFNPQLFGGVLDVEEIRRSAIAIPGLRDAVAPCPLHAILLAVVHRIAHHNGSHELLWLTDISLLARRFEPWDAFVALAAEREVATIAAAALERAHDTVGADVPSEMVTRLKGLGTGEVTARYLNANLLPSDVLFADLRAVRDWRTRYAMVREHLFPPRTYIAAKYGVHSGVTISLAYVWRMMRGAPGWLAGRPAGNQDRSAAG